jgi:hypothetical protein
MVPSVLRVEPGMQYLSVHFGPIVKLFGFVKAYKKRESNIYALNCKFYEDRSVTYVIYALFSAPRIGSGT